MSGGGAPEGLPKRRSVVFLSMREETMREDDVEKILYVKSPVDCHKRGPFLE